MFTGGVSAGQNPDNESVSEVRALLIALHPGWVEADLSQPGCDQAEPVLSRLLQTRPLMASFCVWSLGIIHGSHQRLVLLLPRLLLGYTFTNT